MAELTFDSEKHIYRLDGFIIPSVTQVMKPLSDEKYKDVDQEVLDAAAKRGTAVHSACEFFGLYGAEEIEPEYQPYFDAFLAWNREHEIEYIETEQAIWHKQLLYAGTLDLIALVDGVLTLVDYKTTYRINDMLTAVQLEAYLRALESQGKGADGKAILQLRKNGTYCYKEYPAHDHEAWDVFTSLLKIRAYIEKN